jgi:hypothetical protein
MTKGGLKATAACMVGLNLHQALLGFVALNPTYILPVLLRSAKPNNGRIRNQAPKVSNAIKLAVFWPEATLNTDTW